MSRKTELQRRIDVARGLSGAPGEALRSEVALGAPALPVPPAPTDLAVGTMTIGRSSASSLALVTLTWRPPAGAPVARYLLEVASAATFASETIVARVTYASASATIELAPAATVWARVYALAGAQTSPPSAAISFTTPTDTTPAGPPTAASGGFIGSGDLQISWTNPPEDNLRDVEVRIWASSAKTTLLHTGYSASERLIWTAAENRAAGSGVPDVSVYVELRSRTWAGVLGTPVVVGTVTKAAPATPTGLTVDFTGPDLIITWTAAADAASYRLTLDGVARTVIGGRYVYAYDLNRQEHSGTADPSVVVALVAVDALDQTSNGVSTTATNAAPSAPSAVTLTRGFAELSISVSATPPADFATYRYRLIQTSPAASDVTWDSPATLQTRVLGAIATYQIGVRMVDVFGQAGAETLSSAIVADDLLTLAELRSGARYSDSAGLGSAALKAILADGDLSTLGVSYASSATWARWVRVERDLLDRYRTITLSLAPASGTTSWYLRTSADGSAWSYFAGPVTSGRVLSAVASAAAAQAAAVSAATLGSASASRVDLPSIQEARYVELWLRNTSANTSVREWYPQRLVQADAVETESLAALHVKAGSLTADRLSVLQLSAIAADLGTITAGTITGALIRTAASGARIEQDSTNGLRSYNSGGVVQVQIRTSDGALTFGGGGAKLDASGVALPAGTTTSAPAAIRWLSGGSEVARLHGDASYAFLRSGTGEIGIFDGGSGWVSGSLAVGRGGLASLPSSAATLDVGNDAIIRGSSGGLTVGMTGSIPAKAGTGQILATADIRANATNQQPGGRAILRGNTNSISTSAWNQVWSAGAGLLTVTFGDRTSLWLWNQSSGELIKVAGNYHVLSNAAPSTWNVHLWPSDGYIWAMCGSGFGSGTCYVAAVLTW